MHPKTRTGEHPAEWTRTMIRRVCQAFVALAWATTASAASPVYFFKSFDPPSIGPGSVSTLTFEINSEAGFPVSDLAFADNLPVGVVIATPGNAMTTCSDGVLSASDGTTAITYSGGRLAAGDSCSVSIDVTSSTPGTHTNISGDLTSSAGNSGTATADLNVDPTRPGFSKRFAPSTIAPGGTSTLTLSIDNAANPAALFSLSFTDNLPAGMVVASPANATTDCGGTLQTAAGTGSISLFSGFVGAASSCTVSVDVTASIAGELGNTTGELTFLTGRGFGSSGKAAATLVIARDFLVKSFTDDPVAPGATATLAFTLTNFDRAHSADDIAFSDDLDAVIPGLAAIGLPLADPCGPGSQLTGSGLLTLVGGNLPPEGSCTFQVTVQVPAATTPGAYTNTTSSVTTRVGGADVVWAPAVADLVVEPVPLLSKTFKDDPVAAGGTVTLEFTITNTDTGADATEIAFTDNLAAMLPGLVATLPANGFCGPGSIMTLIPPPVSPTPPLTLSMSGGSLNPGESCTFEVVLQVPVGAPAGTYVNTTSDITARIDGRVLSGNPARNSLVVVAAPVLTKSFKDDPVVPGDTVTLEFTLAYDENAPAEAIGIAFSDDLSATLPGLTALGLPASDVCGAGSQVTGTTNLSLTGGSLAADSSCTFSVSLQVPVDAIAGSHTNTTSSVTATVLGITAPANPARDVLDVAGLTLEKVFRDDPAVPGGTVTLELTLRNTSSVFEATGITFSDDLSATLPGLTAIGLPASDICGTGSLFSGTDLLSFTDGTLGPGTACTFAVTLQVPASASPGEYINETSPVSAHVDGTPVTLTRAQDTLLIADPLMISKAFTDDPTTPGGTVTLEFTLANADPARTATAIAFSDDLDGALSGLTAVGLPASDICGAGSLLTGAGLINFTGGTLAPGATCSFTVTLQVPAGVPFGTTVTNTTSALTGMVGGAAVTGDPAEDDLRIDFLTLTKSFDGPTVAGGSPQLTFTLRNLDGNATANNIAFSDDLDAVLTGLVTTDLPITDVCGAGSRVAGTSFITFNNGTLGPGASCTFQVMLQVPTTATPGDFPNTTSEILVGGIRAGEPASDTLTVEPPPAFSKTFVPATIAAGGTTSLSFTLDNSAGSFQAGALAFSDNLPSPLVIAAPANATTSCSGGTLVAAAGADTISYSGGSLAAGGTCTVRVDVAGGQPGTYLNRSGDLSSDTGTSPPATATLNVVGGVVLDKSFPDSPIPPGGVVSLTFTLVNTSTTEEATQIGFSDDLDAALPGLTALGALPHADVCGPGSRLGGGSGATRLTLTGGRLDAGAECTFPVALRIPASAAPGTYLNRSSPVTAMLGGLNLTSAFAEAEFEVMFLGFTKTFTDDPTLPGAEVTLAFTLTNPNPVLAATELAFTDDLDAVITGLEAIDLPRSGVCGPSSHIAGTSALAFTGGSLGPGESCTVAVRLRVPGNATAGTFTNISSGVTGQLGGQAVLGEAAVAASDPLEILPAPVAIPGIGLWGLLLLGVVLQLSAALGLRRAGA